MKLAFTTLGCPAWDLDTIVSKAVTYGFDGVDFRGYLRELDLFRLPEFNTQLDRTAARFKEAGLEVPCLSSSVRAFSTTPEALDAAQKELRHYATCCRAFGTRFIRIFGGAIGDTPREQAIDILANNLAKLQAFVEDDGLQLLIETHDDWISARHLHPVMERLTPNSAGVLWDTHHPYRMQGENPEETWAALGPWIRNTHWKDSYATNDSGGYQLCLTGDGDIPLTDIYNVLNTHGYTGYLTLEWEKLWCPSIEEPEEAFPGFVHYMRDVIEKQTTEK